MTARTGPPKRRRPEGSPGASKNIASNTGYDNQGAAPAQGFTAGEVEQLFAAGCAVLFLRSIDDDRLRAVQAIPLLAVARLSCEGVA